MQNGQKGFLRSSLLIGFSGLGTSLSFRQVLYELWPQCTSKKGERWDSNPRMAEPQSAALTTWLRSPLLNT